MSAVPVVDRISRDDQAVLEPDKVTISSTTPPLATLESFEPSLMLDSPQITLKGQQQCRTQEKGGEGEKAAEANTQGISKTQQTAHQHLLQRLSERSKSPYSQTSPFLLSTNGNEGKTQQWRRK